MDSGRSPTRYLYARSAHSGLCGGLIRWVECRKGSTVVDFTVRCDWLGRVTADIRARFCPGVKRGRGSAGKWVANAHKNAILA